MRMLARARPHPFGADEARRAIDGGARGIRQRQHRPDVRPAGAERRHGARRHREAASVGTPHVSAYQLTIEPNTAFWSTPPALPAHDESADMQLAVEERPGGRAASSTTKPPPSPSPDMRCRHNLNYWQFGDYLGIGAGAHGKISFPDRITRHERAKQPAMYLQENGGGKPRHRPPPSCRSSSCSMRCAWSKGFQSDSSPSAPGLRSLRRSRGSNRARNKACWCATWKLIRPTERGQRFLNELLALFLPGDTRARESGDRGAARAIRISSPAAK